MKAKIDIEIDFPDGHHVCAFCPFIKYNLGLNRSTCMVTGEIIPFVTANRGKRCPLKFEEDELV